MKSSLIAVLRRIRRSPYVDAIHPRYALRWWYFWIKFWRESHVSDGYPTTHERLSSFFADQLVERWHDLDPAAFDGSLADFMGLTDEQYAAWAECRWEDILGDE